MPYAAAPLGLALGAAIVVVAGCSVQRSPPSSTVDSTFTVAGRQVPPPSVNQYIAAHEGFTSRGGEMRCAYTALGQAGDRIFVNALCLELVRDRDSLAIGSGRGSPVALRVVPEGDSVRIVSHEVPVDGAGRVESIRRIFPATIAARVREADREANGILERHLRAEAERRLGGAGSTAVADSVTELLEARVPRAVAGDSGWRYQQRASADLDGDGTAETAVLIADVRLDRRGRPLWEDGHRWQLYIEEADGARTYVYARFLPNGKLKASLSESSAPRQPTILLLEETPQTVAVYEIGYRGPMRASVLGQFRRGIDPRYPFTGASRP